MNSREISVALFAAFLYNLLCVMVVKKLIEISKPGFNDLAG